MKKYIKPVIVIESVKIQEPYALDWGLPFGAGGTEIPITYGDWDS